MSTTENKNIVLRQWYQELWDKWNVSTAEELFTDNYRLHLPGSAAALDRDATKGVVKMFSVAFPDLQHTVDEMVAEGNTVAARWSVRGTHRGDFQGIAPTGKQIDVSGTTVHHMVNGKIAETWLTFDTMDLLQQLGAVPRPVEA